MWLAYCAMAAALVPLVLMGIGYFFLGSGRTHSEAGENPVNPPPQPPEISE